MSLKKKTQPKIKQKRRLMKTPPTKLKIPPGMTEAEVLSTIEKASHSLSMKFKFGYMTAEDIRQECFLFAYEGLQNYDGRGPLENFLRVHFKNRLCNFKRHKYQRIYEVKCKCKLCKKKVDHEQRLLCPKYKQWHTRNLDKKNIILPIGIDQINDANEENTK